LKRPDKPDVTSSNITIPYVLMEQIDYQPGAPWPTNADGLGGSLQRLVLHAYGNDPTNWAAALPSAGSLNAFSPPPVVTDISRSGASVSIGIIAAPGLTYQLEYKNDLLDAIWIPLPPPLPAGATTLILTDTNSPSTQRFYRVRAQ
jgi:hypothetical protein